MLQQASLWSSVTNCFTPAVLFLLLNLTIAAIALISSLNRRHHHHHQNEPHDHVKIFRSPSILQRLKSINIYAISSEPSNPSPLMPKPNPNSVSTLTTSFISEDNGNNSQISDQPHDSHIDTDPADHSISDNNAEDENEFQSMDEIYSRLKGIQFGRTKSDTEPGSGSGSGLARGSARIRKSASMKPKPAGQCAEEISAVEARRPATARERVLTKVTDGDEEVDAKADDFISRFRQQLQLQRLDSILKYKDRIPRGLVGGR